MFSITDEEFRKLAGYIRNNFGIHLKPEKRSLLIGRLQKILLQQNFTSFSEYYDYIVSDRIGSAALALIDKISTNHTYFMRGADHFTFFKEKVLPFIVSTARGKDLRIWSAGCSTGEEPYTLAMLIHDFLGREKVWWDTRILATDISSKVLEIAKKGIYGDEKLAELPPSWRFNYFRKYDEERSILCDQIRGDVIFRKFNLIEPVYPFKRRFQVIFCRNVLIYFDAQTKQQVVQKFYDFLEPGGYLFLGHSESLRRNETKFRYVMPAIYRKE